MRAQLSTSTDMELGSAECDRLSVAGIDEEADAYAVGERIRARRKELKISAADLARAIGAVPHTIWRYEKKGMMPSAPALQKLAEVLKVTERYLSTGADASVEASVEYDEAVRTALLDLLASWDPILHGDPPDNEEQHWLGRELDFRSDWRGGLQITPRLLFDRLMERRRQHKGRGITRPKLEPPAPRAGRRKLDAADAERKKKRKSQ
jgi:transcriptional regulator with XRE-family HTH domain